MEITGKSVLTLVLIFILATGTVLSNPAALATTITSTIGTSTLTTSTTTIPISTISQTSTSAVSTVSSSTSFPISTVSSTSSFPASTVSETSTSPVSTVSQTSTSPVSTVSQTSTSAVSTISGTSTSAVSTISSASTSLTFTTVSASSVATASVCDPFNTLLCTTNISTAFVTITGTSTVTSTIPISTISETSTSPISTISQTSTSAVSTISQTSTSPVSTISGTTSFPVSTVSSTSSFPVSTVSQTSTSAVSTVSTISESVSTISSTTVTAIPIAEIDEDYRCTAVDFSTLAGLICPIPQDGDGNFLVDAVLSGKTKTTVSSSNPGQLYKVFRIDSGLSTFNALSFTGTLPSNWIVNPNKAPGGVSVLFVPSGSSPLTITGAVLSGISITQGTPDSSNVCGGTPGSVDVTIPNITTAAGEPLGPGDTLYIWVKMQYGLKGQTVNPSQYPCTHPDDADATLDPGAVLVSTSGNLIVSKK